MKNLFSIILSVLLLLSSTGVTYGQHYCGGKVVADALMIGEKQLTCGGSMSAEYSNNKKPGCCENVYHQVETDDNFMTSSLDVSPNQDFVAAFTSVFILQIPVVYTSQITFFSEYQPPPLDKDIPVFYQTFLI